MGRYSSKKLSGRFLQLTRSQWMAAGIIFAIITFVAVSVYVLRLYRIQSQQNSTGIGQGKPVATPLSTTEKKRIVDVGMAYINSQRITSGSYAGAYKYIGHYDDYCKNPSNANTCPFKGTNIFPTTNAWTALAQISAYQLSNNESAKRQALTDSYLLIDACLKNRSQCNWILSQLVEVYRVTNDPKILQFLTTQGQTLLSSTSDVPMLKAIEVRTLAEFYDLTKQVKYLTEAEKRYKDNAKFLRKNSVLYVNNSTPIYGQVCFQILAGIALAKNAPEKQPISSIETAILIADIPRHVDQFVQAMELQPCIEAYYQLARQTSNTMYKAVGDELLAYFVKNFWDGDKQKKAYGDGGTLSLRAVSGFANKEKPLITLTDTSYTMYLLNLAN